MDFYFMQSILDKMDSQTQLLQKILKENQKMSAELDALVAEVAQSITVEESALALIDMLVVRLNDVIAQLQANAVDVTELQTLTDELATERQKIADAVVVNTPAA